MLLVSGTSCNICLVWQLFIYPGKKKRKTTFLNISPDNCDSNECETFTLSIAFFIHKSRIFCQLCVDFSHFSCQRWVQLTGSLYAFQGTKLLYNMQMHTHTQMILLLEPITHCMYVSMLCIAGSYPFVQDFGQLQGVHSIPHHLMLPKIIITGCLHEVLYKSE